MAFDTEKVEYVKTDAVIKINISLSNIEEALEGKNNGITIREAVAATAGHEIEHSTEENIDITITDLTIPGLLDDNAVEKKPEEVKEKYLLKVVKTN